MLTETTTTRADHLAWCKGRALEYLPDDPTSALASMLSDLRKHEATEDHPAIRLAVMLKLNGELRTADEVREFINGFN